MNVFTVAGVLLVGFCLTNAFPQTRSRSNSESGSDSDSWSGFSGRYSRRGKTGTTDAETETFGTGRFGSSISSRQRQGFGANSGRNSDNSFELESFVGFGKVDLTDDSAGSDESPAAANTGAAATGSERAAGATSALERGATNSGKIAVAERPTVVETQSRAKVGEDGFFGGGTSGIAGGDDLSAVDLNSQAGVRETHAFGRSSSRANNRQDLGNTGDLAEAQVGAVSAAAKSDTDQMAENTNSRADDLFVSSSLSHRGEGSKVRGWSRGSGGSSGSFGISFEKEE